MRIANCIILMFFVCWVSDLSAQQRVQPTNESNTWETFKYDANTTWRGMKHAVSRPLHWKGKDFAKFGGLVLGTAVVALADRQTSDFFQRQKNSYPHVLHQYGFYYAKPHNFLIANAAIYGFGLFTKNEQVRKTGVLIISSSFFAGYTQILVRTAVGRARPFSGEDPNTFKPFKGGQDYFSFFSGHTVLGMTMAHSIAKQFDHTWTKIGIYSVGSLPAMSRLIDGAHWLSDVAFGAAFGIIVVDSIDKLLFDTKSYETRRKEKQVSWNFNFTGNQIGVVGTF